MKRSCPYSENLSRMSKVHLMDHDVDRQALQKIYDNTLNKLKDGAKKVLAEQESNILERLRVDLSKDVKPMKQMRLSNFLQHQRSPPKFLDNSENVLSGKSICAFCEKSAPTNACKKCEELFCESCRFILYDRDVDEFLCLSCKT